ncbi:MAG: sensor histidine kinase [Gemmatimonadota bacterium]
MRLQDYIRANVEPILAEWVTFARTRAGAEGMNLVALRDHAGEMLRQIAADLDTPQSVSEEFTKSQGTIEAADDAAARAAEPLHRDSPAETHGADRATSGFSVGEMVAEFRALRASVLRLWIGARASLDEADLGDMMRFNEAIDQAVAESVSRFSRDLERSRDMFIAILSHDLRTPLQTVMLSTQQLLETPSVSSAQSEALHRARRSTERMQGMIDDLLDFTRSRLGAGIGVALAEIDLRAMVQEAVDEVVVAFPRHQFLLEPGQELRGPGDPARLRQVLANLLGNAASHGQAGSPIRIVASAVDGESVIEVWNRGRVIPATDMGAIFGPFKRLKAGVAPPAHPGHLGLGLYIADQIVTAHGGRIDVTSSEADGTCFLVRLPR